MEPGTAALRDYLAPPGEGRRPERFPCRCGRGRAPAGSGVWRQAGWPPLRPVPALTSRILERLRGGGGGCPRPGRAGQPARTAPCGAAARLRRRAAAGSAHAHTHGRRRRRRAGGGGRARGTQRRSPPSPLASPRRGQPAPRPPAGDLAVYLRQVNPRNALPLRAPLRNPARRGAAAGRTEGRADGRTGTGRGARPRSAPPPGRRLPRGGGRGDLGRGGGGARSYSGAAAQRAGAAGGRAMRLRAGARSGGAAAAPGAAAGQGGVRGARGSPLRGGCCCCCAHPPRRRLPPGPGPSPSPGQPRRSLQHGGSSSRRLPRAAPCRAAPGRAGGAGRLPAPPHARLSRSRPAAAQTCRRAAPRRAGPRSAPLGSAGRAPAGRRTHLRLPRRAGAGLRWRGPSAAADPRAPPPRPAPPSGAPRGRGTGAGGVWRSRAGLGGGGDRRCRPARRARVLTWVFIREGRRRSEPGSGHARARENGGGGWALTCMVDRLLRTLREAGSLPAPCPAEPASERPG